VVYAVKPRAVVRINGSKKGGQVDTFQFLHPMPAPADLWQVHYTVNACDNNSPEQFIAKAGESTSNYIEIAAERARFWAHKIACNRSGS
jgi:hypothetical protein